MNFNITKCICYDTSFEEMKTIMQHQKVNTLEELQQIKPVALNCKLCVPYINKMIETGETKFKIIIQ